MEENGGLWIDHREPIIVTLSKAGEETKRIRSGAESQRRRSGDPPNGAFDQGVGSILILGPGEAKGELKKWLEAHGGERRTIAIETADKLTEPQVVAQVRQHFRADAARAMPAGVSS